MLKQVIGQILQSGDDGIREPDQSWLRDIYDTTMLLKLLYGYIMQALWFSPGFLIFDSALFYEVFY